MFEKTSKLQIKKIEEAVKEANQNNEIASPYTKQAPLKDNKSFVITIIIIFILVVLAIIWSVKQVTIGDAGTNILNFFTK